MAVYEPIPGGEAPAVRRKRRIVKATVGLAAVLVVAANVGRHYLSLGRDLELEASVIASTKVVYGDMEAAKVRDLYEQFKRRERRDFDDAEDARRFAIFRRNLATIDTLNAANPAAVFGITSFCDRTDEERQSVKMQTEFSDYASLKRSLARRSAARAPRRRRRNGTDRPFDLINGTQPGDKHLYNYSGGMPTWQWQHGFVNGSGDPAYFNATQGEVAWVSASDCAACDRFPHFGDYDMGNLPDDFDWRALGAVTAVKNQKYCGSCWSFSSAGDIEGTMFLAGDDLISLSTQQLGICMDNMCGGTEIFTGTPTCDKEPQRPPRAGDVAAIEGYQFVAMGAEYEDLMHVALVKNGPLSLAFNANGMEFYVHGVVGCTEQMCEAGGVRDVTDANGMPTGETFDVPYWLIKNSWDTEWGEGGYYRLVRGVNACGVANMVVHSVHKELVASSFL
ncbi:C1 peptidase-like protein [Aureococcus anophagefferens]|nr:C1 peptidase-like protein [Aureococcus anophagefferens]